MLLPRTMCVHSLKPSRKLAVMPCYALSQYTNCGGTNQEDAQVKAVHLSSCSLAKAVHMSQDAPQSHVCVNQQLSLLCRDDGGAPGNSFNMSAAATAPAFSYSGMNASAMPFASRNIESAAYAATHGNAAPFAGMNANAPGFHPSSRASHNSSLLSQRLQAHHASKHM